MTSLRTLCPKALSEVAEAFVRVTLSPDRATVFGSHTAYCSKCAQEVEHTRAFVLAMCDALRAIDLRNSNAEMNGYEVNRALLGDRNLEGPHRVKSYSMATVGDFNKILARPIRWLYSQVDFTEDFEPLEKYMHGAPLPAVALARGERVGQVVESQMGIPNSRVGGLSV